MRELDARGWDLLEALYGAPGEGRAWGRFLELLTRALSPGGIAVFAARSRADQPGMLAVSGLGWQRTDLTDFFTPSMRSAALLPLGGVIDLIADHPVFGASKLFVESLAPLGIRAGPGLILVNERDAQQVIAATLLLPRRSGWKPSASDRALAELLAPHMAIARRLHVRLASRRMDIESLLKAFDHLALGVLLIDRRGRLSFANRSGAEILGIAPGRSDAGAAESSRDAGTEAMHALMRKERGTRDALIYPHPVDGRPLQVFSTPLEWPDAPSEISGQYAQAVFLSDPKTAGNPIGVLRELYDLTPQETRLALLLLADRSLADAAGNLGIRKSTAKSMLKSLFAKTGVRRQASLVRLLLSGPGMFREDSKAGSSR